MLTLINVGSPRITIAAVPVTQLNIAVLSSLPQLNTVNVLLAGLGH